MARAALRGWARGPKLAGGRQEGRVTTLLKYLLRRLRGTGGVAQYLFVATHAEGRARVAKVIKEEGGHVMLRVTAGRMGHRE